MSNDRKKMSTSKTIIAYICVILIPVLLGFYVYKTNQFKNEEENVRRIEREEEIGIIEIEQKKSNLSLLKSNSEIEMKALNMGMHKAATDEIVRVEIK